MGISVMLDCNDLDAQVEFWTAALRYEVSRSAESHVRLAPTASVDGPTLYLQPVPEAKTAKNRMHLDWDVPDMEAEALRLVSLGATRGERFERGAIGWIQMQDPEGNEFCLEQYLGDSAT